MRVLDIALKLLLWFLITTDLSLANWLIGGVVALLLPDFSRFATAQMPKSSLFRAKQWIQMIGQILLAIPRAYIEAIEMMLHPHKVEEITAEEVIPRATRGLVFLDIFLITFTPKTIVVDYVSDDETSGAYIVHSIRRSK